MNTEQLKQLEKDLWSAADNLRANTDLKSSEYATPVLGLIFLKFADNNYARAEAAINKEFAKLTGTRREKPIDEIAIEKCGFYLPPHARYDYLLNLPVFWSQHFHLTDTDASSVLMADESDDKLSWYFVVEIVRCLGLIADSLRRGNDSRADTAILKLGQLEKLAIRAMPGDVSLFTSLLHAVACSYRSASIYRPLERLAELHPEFSDRLNLFARGQFSRGRGILWASQLRGLDRLLNDSSFALCTPTGSDPISTSEPAVRAANISN